MIVSAKEVGKIVDELSKMVASIPKQIERIRKQITLCDREEQDILHTIELTRFNAHEGWKLAKDIQLTRQKRRELKDELEDLSRIRNSLVVNRAVNHHAQSVEDFMKHKKEFRNKRTYTLRVRSDLENKSHRIICSKS